MMAKRDKEFDDAVDTMIDSVKIVNKKLAGNRDKPKKTKTKKSLNDIQTINEYREGLEPGEVKVPKPVGRPSDLFVMKESSEDKVVAQKIYILAAKGTPYKKMRKTLNLTLNLWDKMMRKESHLYPIYKEALGRGNKYAIEEVEDALRNICMGYDYEEKTTGYDGDRDINKTTVKHVKPDVKAIQFFLINKAPEKYRLKQPEDITITHRKEIIDPKKIPIEMLKVIMAAKTTEEIAEAMKLIEPVVTIPHDEVN